PEQIYASVDGSIDYVEAQQELTDSETVVHLGLRNGPLGRTAERQQEGKREPPHDSSFHRLFLQNFWRILSMRGAARQARPIEKVGPLCQHAPQQRGESRPCRFPAEIS